MRRLASRHLGFRTGAICLGAGTRSRRSCKRWMSSFWARSERGSRIRCSRLWASGLPVIASDVGGNRELVTDGVNGFLVAAGDSRALADAIERYAGDEDLRRSHGAASRRIALERFSLEVMRKNYLGMYEQLLELREA